MSSQAARIVAEHWHAGAVEALKGPHREVWVPAAHALAMVLMAFDGETDPLELGIPEYHDDALRLTVSAQSRSDADG